MTNDIFNSIDLEELNGLSEEEKKYALEILKEYSSTGKSQKYEDILYSDYKEIPVDIETFLHDKQYLGKGLTDDEGRFTVFPYWVETLKKVFPTNIDTAYNTLVLSGAIGLGKAQPLDAKVFTKDGYVPMGSISEGTMVYGVDGNLHRVLGVFPQGEKNVYRVTFTDGTSTECCDEHLWTVRVQNQVSQTRTVELKELLNKKLFRLTSGKYKERLYYIPMTEPLNFEAKEHFIHPYILGALIGDGSLTTPSISITVADDEIVEKISRLLDNDYTIHKTRTGKYYYSIKKRNNTAYKVDGVVKPIPNRYAQEISRLQLNVKSVYKHIPKEYLFDSIENRIELLKGLMDTDGTIVKSGSTMQFNTSSEALRDDFIFLVETLGGSAWYHTRTGKYKGKNGNVVVCNNCYVISLKLPKHICPFYISRKRCRINPKSFSPSRAIESIEYIGKKECQCIYVDCPEHLYLTDHLIVTHNTLVAVLCLLYMLYRMMCLKDPYKHYGLQPIDKITFSFINITMDAAKGVAWSKCQELLQSSEWFLARGRVSKSLNPEWQPDIGIELLYGSQPRHIIGRAVFASFEDEISFQQNQDITKQKEKAKALISSVDARMQSRFMKGEFLPTLHILASSKRTDQSFLETYIDMKKRNESKRTLIIDEPQWVIRTDKDSPRKFAVAVGNKFLNSEVIPLSATERDIQVYRDKGYTILYVPMGYYENFIDDIDIALTDIAGISTSNSTRYINGQRWSALRNDNRSNPFSTEILTIGNGKDDTAQYYDYFDMGKIDPLIKQRPLFVHLDMSISGDKTGIAGVWIVGKKPSTDGTPASKDLYYKLAFSVAIKAPKGHQVSFEKNRQFIFWLREQGFNIKGVSTDSFQSYDTGQTLLSHGIPYSMISVDRVDADRICKPYQYFKSTIYEERLETYHTKLLTDEVVGLVRDNNGKIDHTSIGGSIDSKDIADAVCGALYNASSHAEEFAFDYGETLDVITKVSSSTSEEEYKKQISVDFQNELNKMFDPLKRGESIISGVSNNEPKRTEKNSQFMNFGFGNAQPLSSQYLAQGIIVI